MEILDKYYFLKYNNRKQLQIRPKQFFNILLFAKKFTPQIYRQMSDATKWLVAWMLFPSYFRL
jgi:hypothetical protein